MQAQMRFSTGSLELFGLENFGGAFHVPGILTIGPNLRVLGELTGVFTVHAEAHYEVEVLKWDYTQRYPNPNNDVLSGLTDNTDPPDNPGTQPAPDRDSPFRADIGVSGDLTVKVTPLVEFGIRWDPKFSVTDTIISLQLDNYATLYGSAGVGTDTAANVCYGANAGTELFAQLQGPTIFGVNPNRRWSFYENNVQIITEKCYTLEDFSPSPCEDCD
ncbi:hypothetical protein F4819DRAFT_503329 [Hypoxylon fuscum]|nr:hypothetical protein F4819DRAFT_503329 [Hypoxylon fuscum]